MVEKELLNLIFQDFPESLIFAVVCFILLNLRLEWKKVLLVALLQTFTNLVRLLPIAFGMHTVILTISLVFYIRIMTNSQLSKIFIAAITCMVVLITSQIIYLKPMMSLFNLDLQGVNSNPFYRAVFSIPEYIALLLIPAVKKIYTRSRQKITTL
ncbi:MAG TPA: hypothetical protein PK728_06140 [Bacillota bacterium]|nr:hypothetical protein [Bacillota bacterium]